MVRKATTIWVSEETYNRLDKLREKRGEKQETFDQVVNRLIDIFIMTTDIKTTKR